jgi:hypothetical protein
VDRRRAALSALIVFAVATAVAIVISGSRPAGDQGALPWVVQGVGYVFAVLAAVELLLPATHPAGADRKLGGVLLLAVAVMVGLDALGGGGPDIGAGLLRLVCLVVIVAVAARLLTTTLASGRGR